MEKMRWFHCSPQNVERRRLANGDFPVSVFLHAALIGSFEIPQCTPSGYSDQWSQSGHTSD